MNQQDADEFLSATKVLKDRGLETSIVTPNERLRVWRESADLLDISRFNTGWRVERWEHVPGPGPDDFSVAFATLDETLLAVWGYFFGKPISIDGWIIPMHRRPFWTLGRVQYCLANVVHVGPAAFDAIRERREQRARGVAGKKEPGRADQAAASQFLRCDHVSEPNLGLMLRRDLEEGYVIDAG